MARVCWILVAVGFFSMSAARAQSPFFCMEHPNNGFDCVEHGNIFDVSTVACPDPVEEPWCACLNTYFSSTTPGDHPSITQEVLYREDQPTAGDYFVDVSGGTLDLSTVSVGDVVFDFLICIDKSVVSLVIGQDSPLPFKLDFEAIVTAKSATTADVDLTLPPDSDNPINNGILEYNPVDEMHSFGKTFVGTLTSRGPGKGFTFEYHLYQPDPASASPLRGVQDGDLNSPGFTVEALLTLADKDVGLYTNPPCGKVTVETTIGPTTPGAPVEDKTFSSEFVFGGDFTVGITGDTTASVGGSVALSATTDSAQPPTYAWAVSSGTGTVTDNHDGTASVTSGVAGSVTVKLTATACGSTKTAEHTVAFSAGGGKQKPGDENQDGGLDLSDPVSVLNFLFLGTNPSLPCGDGSSTDPANLLLLDANGDGHIDLSDPVTLLGFLFLGSAPPVQCAEDPTCPCISIAGCPDNPACE